MESGDCHGVGTARSAGRVMVMMRFPINNLMGDMLLSLCVWFNPQATLFYFTGSTEYNGRKSAAYRDVTTRDFFWLLSSSMTWKAKRQCRPGQFYGTVSRLSSQWTGPGEKRERGTTYMRQKQRGQRGKTGEAGARLVVPFSRPSRLTSKLHSNKTARQKSKATRTEGRFPLFPATLRNWSHVVAAIWALCPSPGKSPLNRVFRETRRGGAGIFWRAAVQKSGCLGRNWGAWPLASCFSNFHPL